MMTFTQIEHDLLGSEKDTAALAQKDKARVLVVSDSHGARSILHAVIEYFGASCDALVFCGDGIGDFVSCVDEAARSAAARGQNGAGDSDDLYAHVPSVAAFVEGNGDADRFPCAFDPRTGLALQGSYDELIIPRRQLLRAAGHAIFIAHGHEQGAYYGTERIQAEAQKAGADIALYGHTHIAAESRTGGVYMMNPGSLRFPRAGTPPSLAVLELDGKNVNAIFYRIDARLQGVQFDPFFPKKVSLWG